MSDITTGSYGIQAVPSDTPGAFTCGTCGRSWTEDITPAGRCPWEHDHTDLKARVYGALISEGQRTLADEFVQSYSTTEAPEAPSHLSPEGADAWAQGWETGYAARAPRLTLTAKVWLVWTCDNTDEHEDIEHNIEEVHQQLTDVPEIGGAICPQCGEDMTLNPEVEIRA